MAPKCCEGWQIAFSLSCYKAKDFNNVFSEEKDQQFEQKNVSHFKLSWLLRQQTS